MKKLLYLAILILGIGCQTIDETLKVKVIDYAGDSGPAWRYALNPDQVDFKPGDITTGIYRPDSLILSSDWIKAGDYGDFMAYTVVIGEQD